MEHKPTKLPISDLRLAAEKKISEESKASPATHAISHENEIPQELRVHQLELEMQNEELLRTKLALEASLNRYVSLYEFAPVGYLTLTEDGTIAEANLTSANLLGENRPKLIKQRFSHFIEPEDGDRWHQHFNCVMQHGKSKRCEIKMRRADGTQFYARLDCLLLSNQIQEDYPQESNFPESNFLEYSLPEPGFSEPNLSENALQNPATNQDKGSTIKSSASTKASGNGLMVRVALTDVTEIKLAEQELSVAATVFESQEGMMVTDANNVILKVNQAFTNITGYSAYDCIDKTPNLLASGRHDAEFYAEMWLKLHNTGAWQGEIWNRRKDGEIFPQWLTITVVKGEDGAVTNYVATITDITARKRAEDEMQMLAFYDSLTRLPNRRLFLDRLQRAMTTSARNRQYCALMFVDLDNFKPLNDSLGHDVGDLMLQTVAQRLAICVREGDTVSRTGGDEFMVMLENLSENLHEATHLAEVIGNKILTAIKQPFQLAGHECLSTASIGVALFINHSATVPEVQKQADVAMYAAKSAGRNVLRFYKLEV